MGFLMPLTFGAHGLVHFFTAYDLVGIENRRTNGSHRRRRRSGLT